MNKTVLIAGGTAVVSLAIGGAAGFAFAKKKMESQVAELITAEVLKTKKHYSLLMQQMREGKPESPADLVQDNRELPIYPPAAEMATPAIDSEPVQLFVAQQRAAATTVDYTAYSRGDLTERVQNIFDREENRPPAQKPRDPQTGRFVSRSEQDVDSSDPYIISFDDFATSDNPQRQLYYFYHEQTLIDPENENEVVDTHEIGEENLNQFRDPETNEIVDLKHLSENQHLLTCTLDINVHNPKTGEDYSVTLRFDRLEHMMTTHGDHDAAYL